MADVTLRQRPPAGPRWREVDPDLRRALAPVAWAVWRQGAARVGAVALAGVCGWALLVVALSRAMALPNTGRLAALGAALVVVGAVVLLCRRPAPRAAAVAGDRAGLKERLLTALELRDAPGVLARAQRADAIASLHTGGWRAQLRVQWPRRLLWAALLMAAAAAALLFLSDRGAELRRRQAEVQAAAARQADLIGKLADSLAPPGGAAVDQTRSLAAQALRKLAEQLRETRGGQEAMIDLTEASKALQQLADAPRVNQGRALLELSSSLASTEGARQAASALSRRDWAGAQRGLESLADALDQSSGDRSGNNNQVGGPGNQSGQPLGRNQQQALARTLAEASRTAGPDTPLGQALQQAARELMAGNTAAAADALRALARLAAETGRAFDSQTALTQSLQQLQSARLALAAAQNPAPRPPAQGGRQGQPGQQGRSGQSGQPGQQGQQGRQGQQGQQGLAEISLPFGQQGSGQSEDQAGQDGDPNSDELGGQSGQQGADMGAVTGGTGDGAQNGSAPGQGDQQGQGYAQLLALGLLQGPGNGQGGGGQGQNGDPGDQGGGGPGTNSTDRVSMGGVATGPQQSRTGDAPLDYRQFEQIYAPSRLGGGQTAPDYLSGPLGEGAGQAVETDSSPVGAPVLRPYSQVYAQYQQQAREGLDRSDLPQSMQEMVKQYFSNLSPSDGTGGS